MAKVAAVLGSFLERKADREEDALVLPIGEFSIPRRSITEVIGGRSSGRTALIHTILAASTSLGEACAVIDAADSFDPVSSAANGVSLDRIFWVRCHGRADHAMKAADWILNAGGFGVVVLDLCEISQEMLRRVPISWWYRYRNAIENTKSSFVVVADRHLTGSCAARIFGTDQARPIWSGSDLEPLLTGIEMTLVSRKPAASNPARYEARLAG
jgi:recombination protein RecA